MGATGHAPPRTGAGRRSGRPFPALMSLRKWPRTPQVFLRNLMSTNRRQRWAHRSMRAGSLGGTSRSGSMSPGCGMRRDAGGSRGRGGSIRARRSGSAQLGPVRCSLLALNAVAGLACCHDCFHGRTPPQTRPPLRWQGTLPAGFRHSRAHPCPSHPPAKQAARLDRDLSKADMPRSRSTS